MLLPLEVSLSKHRSSLIVIALSFCFGAGESRAQLPTSGVLVTRAELNAEADRAEIAAAGGDASQRSDNATLASAIRQRLRDGDFQVGDRIIVSITADSVRRDTVVVRSDRSLELPGPIVIPLSGALRSELRDRVSTEVLKYVKAREIAVTPLTRVGILGAVGRPGYFAVPADMPLTDVIMVAGGPTERSDLDRAVVRRGTTEVRSAAETRQAFATGLTLDQFGLNAGDEIIIGNRRDFNPSAIAALAGAVTSLFAVYFALSHHD
jgi:protein involved in polysaccharide export with SLBB domain